MSSGESAERDFASSASAQVEHSSDSLTVSMQRPPSRPTSQCCRSHDERTGDGVAPSVCIHRAASQRMEKLSAHRVFADLA